MAKEADMLAKKLGMAKQGIAAPTKSENKINGYSLHNILITDEHSYKVETMLYFTANAGTEFSININKQFVSEEILIKPDNAKNYVTYIFFAKPDGEFVPIKECIITEVAEQGDDMVFTFIVGLIERPEIRKTHRFKLKNEDKGKKIFTGVLV